MGFLKGCQMVVVWWCLTYSLLLHPDDVPVRTYCTHMKYHTVQLINDMLIQAESRHCVGILVRVACLVIILSRSSRFQSQNSYCSVRLRPHPRY